MTLPPSRPSKRSGSVFGALPEDGLAMRPYLFLLLDCDDPAAGGARFGLDSVEEVTITFGSERASERRGRLLRITLTDPGLAFAEVALSRRGALWQLERTADAFVRINGNASQGGAITEGALIEIGRTLFTFRTLPGSEAADVVQVDPLERKRGLATLLPAYAARLERLRCIMRTRIPILLLGESGTGKELLARAAHAESGRNGACVPVNCGAIPEGLLESHLFGHQRGAFSGAVRSELGFVRAADGGTLFLDEIADLPRQSQAALLRVLQEGEVLAVGSSRPLKVDLRVVSATHRPVEPGATVDGFRVDLYARLAGYVHELPALRERREDLGVFLPELLSRLAPERAGAIRFAPELARALYEYHFPLNVRELEHALASALALADGDRLELAHLPCSMRFPRSTRQLALIRSRRRPLTDADARLSIELVEHLREHRGNVTQVARVMGRTRMQIHRWMRRFGIEPGCFRHDVVDEPPPSSANL